ncbi:MAG: metalloregulator ArsR/SmtB family transcription factor [Anaerolineae bacterium]
MIRLQLSNDDLAKMRFGYSPLIELMSSFRVLHRPERQYPYLRWVEEAKQVTYDLDLPYLHVLTNIPFYIPDFLTPTPSTTITNLEDEITNLRNVSTAVIRKNIKLALSYNGETDILLQFLVYPRELIECLIEEIRIYWQRTLAHHWTRMHSVLDGDVLFRARQLALGGPDALLTGLNDKIRFRENRIEWDADHKPQFMHKDYHLPGEGVQLVPSIFLCNFTWQIEPEWRPMLSYHARGAGLWYQTPKFETDPSLEIALGETRARVLRLLATPTSTGEIARILQITAGAASQHLSRLGQAGLVEPHRSGKRVYYHLTSRGTQLVALFN